MPTFPIIINSSHWDTTTKNRFIYKFPSNVKFDITDEVALQSISIYNSIFNVESSRSNNTVSIIWNADTSVQYNWTLPDGNYSVAQLNYFLQQQMILNDLYVIDTSGNFVYFLELLTNPTGYSCQINAFALPTSAQATTLGYTKPSGASWDWPASASTPQFIVTTSGFGSLIGFEPATFPSAVQATDYQALSSKSPDIAVVSSLILSCNLIQSRFSSPVNAFYSFSIKTQFGGLMDITNSSPVYNSISSGLYSQIVIEILDQNFDRVILHDFDVTITLSIKTVE